MNLPNTSMSQYHDNEVKQMLEALPPGSSEYDAENLNAEDLENLLQENSLFTYTIQHVGGDHEQHFDRYIVFKNVALNTMRDFSNQKHLGRIKDQSYKNHLVILNMPSRGHESSICYFDKLLQRKLDEMRPNLSLELQACGATDVHGTTRIKTPDASYWSRQLPATRSDKWPNLVLEVGYSESASKLRNDASWWLTESQGDVQMVITLKIFRHNRVHLEMWKFRDGAARPRPIMTQEVTVTKSASGYSASGSMVIRFQDLLLRRPISHEERDIVLDRDDLQGLVELALGV
ncbi:hypothetical protein AJ78_06698 [Emergomyces pasteurianus Ep9510]|uniref:Uncharacterized protein n=1 Tax=Emergomyces pasteurianus Ep9510 TaxID=1447872 RepID=A0A1J9P9L0_9EURO|nr:hypothetical protein AJ78_06698 [Emergomyces pasteurianus Ep9510]